MADDASKEKSAEDLELKDPTSSDASLNKRKMEDCTVETKEDVPAVDDSMVQYRSYIQRVAQGDLPPHHVAMVDGQQKNMPMKLPQWKETWGMISRHPSPEYHHEYHRYLIFKHNERVYDKGILIGTEPPEPLSYQQYIEERKHGAATPDRDDEANETRPLLSYASDGDPSSSYPTPTEEFHSPSHCLSSSNAEALKGYLPYLIALSGFCAGLCCVAVPYYASYAQHSWLWLALWGPVFFFGPLCIVGASNPGDSGSPKYAYALGVGFFLLLGTISGTYFGIQAGNIIAESDRILDGGLDPHLCPSSDPRDEKNTAVMWAEGSGIPPIKKAQWGGHQWQEEQSTDDGGGVTYYCVVVSPVLAPEKTSKQSFGGLQKCERAASGPITVNFWAFFSSSSDDSKADACQNAIEQMKNKKGGVVKDYANLVVLHEGFESGSDEGTDLQDDIAAAKASVLSATKGAFVDNEHAKYVVLSDDPQGDAKSARGTFLFLLYAYGVWLLGMFVCFISWYRKQSLEHL